MKNGSETSSELKFVDEKLHVIPDLAEIFDRPSGAPESAPGAEVQAGPQVRVPGITAPELPGPDFSEDDLLFMSEAIWSLPNMVWDRVPVPEPDKLEKWNHQFYRYCVKKGINPFDWFFDEFPLAIATISMGGEMYKGYKASEPRKEEVKSKKGEEEWKHEQDLAAQKAKDLEVGVITTHEPGQPASV